METKKNNLNHDISIIDTPTSPNIDTSEANLIPTSIEELEAMDYEKRHLDTQKRSFNALRVEKAVATRKARAKYKKNVQVLLRSLSFGHADRTQSLFLFSAR